MSDPLVHVGESIAVRDYGEINSPRTRAFHDYLRAYDLTHTFTRAWITQRGKENLIWVVVTPKTDSVMTDIALGFKSIRGIDFHETTLKMLALL